MTTQERLDSFIDEYKPRFARILTRMWQGQENAITYKELREAILSGQLDMKWYEAWQQDYTRFIHTDYATIVDKAVRAASKDLVKILGGDVVDQCMRGVGRFIEYHGGQLIVQVTQDQYKAVNALVRQASMVGDMTVDQLARAIRPCIGLTERQSRAAMSYYQQLVNDGMNAKKAQTKAAVYAERMHRTRADTIAITEMAFCYNHGAQTVIETGLSDGLILPGVQKKWICSDDERICPVCGALHNQVVDMDAPFDLITNQRTDHKLPPAHPKCRCVVVYVNVKPNAPAVTAKPPEPPEDQPPETPLENPEEENPQAETPAADNQSTDRHVESCGAITGVPEEYRQGVVDRLENAPDYIRNAWNDTSGKLNGPVFDRSIVQVSYYDIKSNTVHLKQDKSLAFNQNQSKVSYQTYFHEYGHNIDCASGWISNTYQNGVFGQSLWDEAEQHILKDLQEHEFTLSNAEIRASQSKKDVLQFLKQQLDAASTGIEPRKQALIKSELEIAYSSGDRSALEKLYNDLIKPKDAKAVQSLISFGGISAKTIIEDVAGRTFSTYPDIKACGDSVDLIDAYCACSFGTDFAFGFGHGKSYWSPAAARSQKETYCKSKMAIEGFAEMYSAETTNPESNAVIQKIFPNSYGIFKAMLGGT